MRKGDSWLKTTLVQCAVSASTTKGTYLKAQYNRLKAQRGHKKAICAVAASILTAIYHMLTNGTLYQDLGPDHFDKLDRQRHTKRLVNRLKDLGYDVQLTPLPAAA